MEEVQQERYHWLVPRSGCKARDTHLLILCTPSPAILNCVVWNFRVNGRGNEERWGWVVWTSLIECAASLGCLKSSDIHNDIYMWGVGVGRGWNCRKRGGGWFLRANGNGEADSDAILVSMAQPDDLEEEKWRAYCRNLIKNRKTVSYSILFTNIRSFSSPSLRRRNIWLVIETKVYADFGRQQWGVHNSKWHFQLLDYIQSGQNVYCRHHNFTSLTSRHTDPKLIWRSDAVFIPSILTPFET